MTIAADFRNSTHKSSLKFTHKFTFMKLLLEKDEITIYEK